MLKGQQTRYYFDKVIKRTGVATYYLLEITSLIPIAVADLCAIVPPIINLLPSR